MALGTNLKTGELEYIMSPEEKAALEEAIIAPQPVAEPKHVEVMAEEQQ